MIDIIIKINQLLREQETFTTCERKIFEMTNKHLEEHLDFPLEESMEYYKGLGICAICDKPIDDCSC